MKIREIREARGLSGSEVARRLGIPQSTYSTWETGKVAINVYQACDLCDVFGCTLDQLAGRERGADGTWREIEDIYASLNNIGRDKLVDYAEDLASNPRNTQKSDRRDTSSA